MSEQEDSGTIASALAGVTMRSPSQAREVLRWHAAADRDCRECIGKGCVRVGDDVARCACVGARRGY